MKATMSSATVKSSLAEVEGLHGNITSVVTEWWNGEGFQVDMSSAGKDAVVDFHLDEAHLLVAQLISMGLIDLSEVLEQTKSMVEHDAKRKKHLEELRSKYADSPWSF